MRTLWRFLIIITNIPKNEISRLKFLKMWRVKRFVYGIDRVNKNWATWNLNLSRIITCVSDAISLVTFKAFQSHTVFEVILLMFTFFFLIIVTNSYRRYRNNGASSYVSASCTLKIGQAFWDNYRFLWQQTVFLSKKSETENKPSSWTWRDRTGGTCCQTRERIY